MPTAVLRFWIDEANTDTGLAEAEIFRLTRGKRGFHRVAPGILAITAESGDPAIFDTALHLGDRIAAAARKSDAPIKFLVLPGEIHLENGSPLPLSDRLVELAPQTFADLDPGVVHVTGWVLRMLELSRASSPAPAPAPGSRSHDRPPLFKTGRRLEETTPWRNAEILNRKIKTIPRRELEAEGTKLLPAPAWTKTS